MFAFILSLTLSLTAGPSTDLSKIQLEDSTKRPVRTRHLSDSTSKRNLKSKTTYDSTARFVRINRIFIVGNRITRDRIILRELSLRQGDLIYSEDLPGILELDKKKLINTRLFNIVNLRTLELEKDSYDLLVDLKERWYTFPSPIFDLADRNFNEWWENYNHDFRRVNYGLRLYQFNMRGRNETLRFVAQFGYLRRFEISYRIPYFDREQKHGLALDFDFSEAKNVAARTVDHILEYQESDNILRTTRGGGITYQFRNSFYETHALKLEFRNNSINDSVLRWNPNYLGGENKKTQQYAALGYSFTSDHRDYQAYPLRGYYFSGHVMKSGLTNSDDLNKVESTVTFAKFFDLKRNFFLSNNFVGYLSSPKELPYFNYGALGYKKQFIRGYELYVIEGPSYFMNKTTFKKRILSRTYHWNAMPLEQFRHVPLAIYFKTYADIAYVNNYSNYEIGNRLTNKLLSGIGSGFDVVGSYDFVMRFEYTFNIEGESGFFFHLKKEF